MICLGFLGNFGFQADFESKGCSRFALFTGGSGGWPPLARALSTQQQIL